MTKSPEEARRHSPLYLDIVEDGILLIDRADFLRTVLDGMRAHAGAREPAGVSR